MVVARIEDGMRMEKTMIHQHRQHGKRYFFFLDKGL
jgi:hypothetical protein